MDWTTGTLQETACRTTMVVQPWYGWAWVSDLINTPFLEMTPDPAYEFHCIQWGRNNTPRTHEPSVGDGTQHILCGGSPKSFKTFPEDRIRPANETEKKEPSINLNKRKQFQRTSLSSPWENKDFKGEITNAKSEQISKLQKKQRIQNKNRKNMRFKNAEFFSYVRSSKK